jgi:hypothetical protein
MVSAICIIGILALVSKANDEVGQLRGQMNSLKSMIAAYQADEKKMPKSNDDLIEWDDQSREALIDPWNPDQLLNLNYSADGVVVKFENEHVVATIGRDMTVSIVEK